MGNSAAPFVHVNLAIDSDGEVGAVQGKPRSISCDADWNRVHLLREKYDGIAVGGRTWILDRPRLTARREWLGREPSRQPVRVVFAGGQPCGIAPDPRPTYVISHSPTRGEGVIHIPTRGRELRGPLERLAAHGVRSMLVEGGPMLANTFLEQGFADVVTLYMRAPGPDAMTAARRLLPALPELGSARPLGSGLLLEFTFRRSRGAAGSFGASEPASFGNPSKPQEDPAA